MFYQQLKEPAHQSNIGLSYWIELRRNGRMMRVDSREHFRGGDKIKFHITPNIEGHAHIVMLSGSSGKQAVLFPVPGKDTTNVVHRGRDYAIPSTYLVFDNTKGREHLRIALSRHDVDSSVFLQDQAPTKVAMATISPNPAVDPSAGRNQIKVSFPEDIPKPKPRPAAPPPKPVADAAPPPTNDAPIADAIPNDDSSKDLFREDSAPVHAVAHASHHSYHPAAHHAYHPAYHASSAYRPPAVYTPPPPPPSTVVLNTNANEDLFADISLEHD
jgi:hypothetical protein